MTEENFVEALTQAERKLTRLYAAIKTNPEILKILDGKDFAKIEKKQAVIAAMVPPKQVQTLEDSKEIKANDKEQKEEMIQQLNERNKLKHEALNRYEKKLKMKTKKPRTAVGQKRGFL